MRYINKLDFICKGAASALLIVAAVVSTPAWAASTDYYIKIDDVKGESREAEESGSPISGIDSGEEDINSEGRAETQTTGIEPDEIDVSIDSETSAAVDVFIKIPPIDGETKERLVGLDGLYIDYLDDDSDDDNLEADHEAEITLKGQVSEARPPVIRVDAKAVRAWDQQTKEAVRSRLDSKDTQNNTADIGLFVALQALDNEAITDISVEDDTTVVAYNTKLSIFGFIPVEVKAEARVAKDGEVKVKYPWWHFLARKSSDDTYRNIATEISARIAIEEEGVPAVDEKH